MGCIHIHCKGEYVMENNWYNQVYDRFFMMDVILDDDGQSVSSLYFHIDDVVAWKTTVSIDPKSFYIDLMFKGGHTVCTIHQRVAYDDIILELEHAKCTKIKASQDG